MGRLLLAGCLILLGSCSSVIEENLIRHRGYDVEERLLPYVLEFEQECGIPIDGDVKFYDFTTMNKISDIIPGDNMRIIGMCWPLFFGDVYIDKNWWDSEWDHYRKEELMFHEFGHCVLHRLHDDTEGEFGLEKSVMSSAMFYSPFQWEMFREKYIKELCK